MATPAEPVNEALFQALSSPEPDPQRRTGEKLDYKRLVLTMVSTGIFVGLAACGGVNQNEVTPNSTPTAISQWYEGGTLHGATIADWKSATARNRLATSADFVMVSGQYQSLPPDLRDRAVQFEECISTATQGVAAVDTSLVSEIAAACGLLLQYHR